MSLDWVTHLDPEAHDADIAQSEWLDEMSASGFLNPDEAPLPANCDRCGTEFGPVSLVTVTDQFGQTEQEMVGALLIGSRWVCPACEDNEYQDYYSALTDWSAIHEDNQFESQREDSF